MKHLAKTLLKIEPGQIIVNDFHVITAHEDVIVYEVDLASKRAEVLSYHFDRDNSITVNLVASENTLYIDDTTLEETGVRFSPIVPEVQPSGETIWPHWSAVAEVFRYTAILVFYKLESPEERLSD